MRVTTRPDRGVTVIELHNPPVNGLSHALRVGLAKALEQAMADDAVRAVVVTGSQGIFSAGADIREFGTPLATQAPTLRGVIELLDECGKPVVAAIDGPCLGGGLELALAMHHRVATSSSRFALPEVTLGLVPGAGGTQRLPRALGAAAATDMVTDGAQRSADDLARIPGQVLLDRVVTQDCVTAAIDLARSVSGAPPQRLRDRSVTALDPTYLARKRSTLKARNRGAEAPIRALDLMDRAASVSFDEAVAEERRTFERLVVGPESAGMRHAFFAERQARKVEGLPPGTSMRPIESAMVVGAGTMGSGIAMALLNAGYPVLLVDNDATGIERGRARITATYADQVERGRITVGEADTRMQRLRTVTDIEPGADCDLVVEAAFEDWDVKSSIFTQLDQIMKPGAVLATNTSTLDVNRLATVTSRPEDVIGLHFFSPAHVMKLLEVVRGERTAPDLLATAVDLARRIGKTPVVSGVCDGFIGNRMLASYREAAGVLLLRGLEPREIDAAIESFGFAMGPYRVGDLAGNDVGWAVRKRRYAENPTMPRDEIADAVCELGRFGQKTGGGWYDYPDGGRVPVPSPVVTQLLAKFRPDIEEAQRPTDEQIAEQLVFALVDEGARILEEGIAQRASDIDVVYVAGYGFPRHKGGPMHYANQVGLDKVLAALRVQHDDGWQPAPLLERLAKEGGRFR